MKFSTLVLLISTILYSNPARFDLRDALGRNYIYFLMEAPLGKVLGRNNGFTGWVQLNPDNLSEPIEGELKLDLRNFDLGNTVYNDAFREKYLNTSENTFATITFQKITALGTKVSLVNQQAYALTIEGVLKIHEKSIPVMIQSKVYYFKETKETKKRLPGNLFRISGSFDLDPTPLVGSKKEVDKLELTRNIKVYVELLGSERPLPLNIPIIDLPKAKK
jgi:hypothetical protein